MPSLLRGLLGLLVGTVLAHVGLIAFYATAGEKVFGFDRDLVRTAGVEPARA